MTPYTQFWDMHSGGGCKESSHELIYIQAPLEEAKLIFYNKFGHNPERISCTCCGSDYAIYEYPTFEEAHDFHNGREKHYLVIKEEEIKPEWRTGSLPEQGYIWIG